jgi:PAS domain S-box-containing protein
MTKPSILPLLSVPRLVKATLDTTTTTTTIVAVPKHAKHRRVRATFSRVDGRDFRVSMQSNLSQFQRRQLTLLSRVSPFSIAGHLVNTTIVAVALAGSVPQARLIIWCTYSYSLALPLLYRHLKKRGRSPRDFKREARKITIYAFLLAVPWNSLAVLYLGALPRDQELIVVALAVGTAATGTILLSTMPLAAFVYVSGILIPSALKCFALNEKGYLLLGALAVSCWGFLIALIAKISRDIRERERAEQSFAEQSVQRTLAERAALVGSFAYDTDTERMEISPGYAAIHGFPEETAEIPRREWLARVHPEDVERLQALRSGAFGDRRREYNTDYRIVRDGEVRWIDARSFIEYDNNWFPRRVLGVNIDVTERKQAEEHRKLLNAELDHRVKNALATVSAVVSHTVQERNSLAEFVAALEGRVRSMATTHELLSASRWQGIPLRQLVGRELAPYATKSNTDVDGLEVFLKPQAGQAMAMVLHELVTNAAKYGALSVPGGHVSVRWMLGAQSGFCVHWQERGGPHVVPQIHSGYGTSVIRDMIPYSLGGVVNLVHARDGVRCKVEIPDRWVIGGIKPAMRPVDAAPPCSLEIEQPTAPIR